MKPYNDTNDKKSQIREMFDNIAPTYDRLNHLLSMNVDRLWRRRTVRIVAGQSPAAVLDVATGTGDLALALARKLPGARICGVDLSAEMLKVAAEKLAGKGFPQIELSQGDAEHLDFGDATFDAVTVAFGVRNFEDIPAGLREMHRVLRPGGIIAILELATPRNRAFGAIYNGYSHTVLPRIGGMVSSNAKAYEYLPASVDEFPSPERFTVMMQEAGFRDCRWRSQSFGIATIFTALK